MKISHKILAITFLISSAAIAGIAGLTINAATDALRDLSKKRLFDNISREARIIQNSVDMVKSDIAMLGGQGALGVLAESAESPPIDNLQMLGDQLDTMMRKRAAYAQIQVVLAGAGSPRVVRSTRFGDTVRTFLDPPVLNPSYQNVLREAQGLRTGEVLVGPARQDEKDGSLVAKRVLYFSSPVIAKNGTTVGAVAVVVDFEALVRGMGRPHDDIDYYVTDSTGRYLFRSMQEPDKAGKGAATNILDDFRLHERWAAWLSQEDRHLQAELADQSMVVDLHRIELLTETRNSDRQILVVGGAASLADVEMKAVKFRSELAIVVLGVGTLMALALALATAYLTRPIGKLTAAANRIAAGDRNVVAPTHQRDEIGVLARAVMRMAEALRNAAKNDEQAAMGRMATMIAHDLRNALSSIKMNLKILYTHHRGEGDDYSDGCEIALEQVRYMENILNDMLAFARPDSMELDWVNLGDTIRTATVSLLPDVTRKSINIETGSDDKLPTVLGDRNKLLQVFQNVLDNAIQAAPEGGHVSIEARPLLHGSQPAVEIKIVDDGAGIPAEVADKIFEPFFTTRARGTGLGLAIVQRIVKQHGGQVHLAPAPGGGTVATIVLPLTPVAWNQEPASAPEENPVSLARG